MKNRVQVTDPLFGRAPRPQAPGGPGDIYVPAQATRPTQDNSLSDLGNALGGLNSVLVESFVEDNEIQDKEDFAAGLAAYEKSRGDLKKAVDDGLLPQGANPAHRRGWQARRLENMGGRFSTELLAAVGSGSLGP